MFWRRHTPDPPQEIELLSPEQLTEMQQRAKDQEQKTRRIETESQLINAQVRVFQRLGRYDRYDD